MSSKTLLEKFASLSDENKKEVIDFIDFLKNQKEKPVHSTEKAKTKLEDEKFIGMWENRIEMRNSSAWVRKIRKSEWPD